MKVRSERLEGGAIVRLVLDAGKGNVLDREALHDLSAAHAHALEAPEVRAILLDHEGPHFSFGASVPEHAPEVVGSMLPVLHAAVRQLAASPVPVVACVRGACLGGGLEVALACTRIVAAPDAKLGQPEVKLGVFAPVASVLLPRRVGDARAAAMLLHGEPVSGEEALRIGLVDELAPAPRDAALAFARPLLELSASSIRQAHLASRCQVIEALRDPLARLEARYLGVLMSTDDAREGIAAFLEKRAPSWRHR